VNLSRSSQYAIRALTYLAEREPGKLNPIRQIASRVGIPLPFLNKILSRLSHHGMVTTRRGRNGGAMLSRPADQLTIGDVVGALDGPPGDGVCFLGLAACSDEQPCPVHDGWKAVRSDLSRALHARTFGELSLVGHKVTRSAKPTPVRRRSAK